MTTIIPSEKLLIEKLESRELCAVDTFFSVALLPSVTTTQSAEFWSEVDNGGAVISIGESSDGVPMVVRHSTTALSSQELLSRQLTGESVAIPAQMPGANVEKLTTLTRGFNEGPIMLGAIVDGRAAVLRYQEVDGGSLELVSHRQALGEEIIAIVEHNLGQVPTLLVRRFDGATILSVDGLDYQAPARFQAHSLSRLDGIEPLLCIGGRTLEGQAALVTFSPRTLSFSEVKIVAESNAAVDAFFNQYDGAQNPALAVVVSETNAGFAFGTIAATLEAQPAPVIISEIDDARIISSDGIFAYPRNGEWFLYIQPESLQNSIGLPVQMPISLDNLLAEHGYTDVVIDRVTDLISRNTGDLVILADVSISGFGPFTLAIMASDPTPLQNAESLFDVNRDNFINAIDALVVINELNRNQGSREVREQDVYKLNFRDRGVRGNFMDSNGDGYITAIDALIVINYLNRFGPGSVGGGEGEGAEHFRVPSAKGYGQSVDQVEALLANSDLVQWIERRRRG